MSAGTQVRRRRGETAAQFAAFMRRVAVLRAASNHGEPIDLYVGNRIVASTEQKARPVTRKAVAM
jgi:hypothetical protein